MSSRNNPEMSQRSSDVPILVNFSIYFHDIFTELAGIIKIILRGKTLTFHRLPLKSETFKKSQMSEPIEVPSGYIGPEDNAFEAD